MSNQDIGSETYWFEGQPSPGLKSENLTNFETFWFEGQPALVIFANTSDLGSFLFFG